MEQIQCTYCGDYFDPSQGTETRQLVRSRNVKGRKKPSGKGIS